MVQKKHEQGFEIYKKHNGKISNAEIAQFLDASESTVRKWKSRYKWNEKLGIKTNVTSTKEKNVTKNIRKKHREQIIETLTDAGIYSPALDLLIEIYLDAYEEYHELKNKGIAEEKHRRELARLLRQLGIDGKNKNIIAKSGNKSEKDEEISKEVLPQKNKLLLFRQRMAK